MPLWSGYAKEYGAIEEGVEYSAGIYANLLNLFRLIWVVLFNRRDPMEA
jgi:hypothetical protein